MAQFVLDPSYRRPGDGRVVIAGSPLKLFRLGAAGVRLATALENGEALPSGHEQLTDRLVAAGAIHPTMSGAALEPAQLTIVVPAYGKAPMLVPGACRVVVVDDASPTPIRWPAAPGCQHATLLRLDVNSGPGAARNAGLGDVDTPYVAFVDSDVTVDEAQLLLLAGQLDGWSAAAVAPRVVADAAAERARRPSLTERFERSRSPLDLGPLPARVVATTRVSYVPAAVLVCRTDALRAVGGFDEALRFGEDVDLVWRLDDHGHTVRYEPQVTVGHRTRATWPAWLAQRFHYGTSAAPLAQRHPRALAPVRMSGWSIATWAAIVAGHPVVGASIGVGTTAALVRKLPDVPAAESLRLAGLGHLYAGKLLAATMVRAWWPAAVAMALVSRRARRALLAAMVVTAISEARAHRGRLDPVRAAAIHALDDAAYGAGVWAGMRRTRSLAAILPVLSSWPGRRPAGGSGARHEA